mmetsp:Transcript_44277/g.137901  ORF Transcript_44277/g.137901 Transcript_44277/m.137901 type:complete len:393 (+) Transcript_44277:224-1402(+)
MPRSYVAGLQRLPARERSSCAALPLRLHGVHHALDEAPGGEVGERMQLAASQVQRARRVGERHVLVLALLEVFVLPSTTTTAVEGDSLQHRDLLLRCPLQARVHPAHDVRGAVVDGDGARRERGLEVVLLHDPVAHEAVEGNELDASLAEGAGGGHVPGLALVFPVLLSQRDLAVLHEDLQGGAVEGIAAAPAEAAELVNLVAVAKALAATENAEHGGSCTLPPGGGVAERLLHPRRVDVVILTQDHEPPRAAAEALLQEPLLLARQARLVIGAPLLYDEACGGEPLAAPACDREEAALPRETRGPRLHLRSELLPVLGAAVGHHPVDDIWGLVLLAPLPRRVPPLVRLQQSRPPDGRRTQEAVGLLTVVERSNGHRRGEEAEEQREAAEHR